MRHLPIFLVFAGINVVFAVLLMLPFAKYIPRDGWALPVISAAALIVSCLITGLILRRVFSFKTSERQK